MFNPPKSQFGSSVFGSSNNSNLFGANKTTGTGGGLFGSNSANNTFGAASSSGFANNTGSSLFGSAANKPATNIFGTPAQSSGFGATASNSSFGGTSGFGKTSSGLFGSSTAGTSSFSSGGGNLFGSSSGAFGAQQQNGTGVVKFSCQNGSDVVVKNGVQNNIQTRHQCISAMKEYESKSLEELHFEDKVAGRKGGSGASAFGQTSSSTAASSSFAFPNTNNNQSGNTSLFGTQNKTGFNSAPSGGNLFGSSSNTAGTSLFSSGNKFGSTTATTSASTGFSFGNNNMGSSSMFNKPAGGGLFGSTATTTTTAAGTSLFNNSSSSNAFGSGFGNTSGGLFGNKTNAFGTATTSAGGTAGAFSSGFSGFNNAAKSTASTGGLFGNTTGGFGSANTASGGLFGSSTAKPNFGTTGGSGGLFGGNKTATNTGGGLFSSGGFGATNTNTAGGLFGSTAATSNALGGGGGFGGFNAGTSATAGGGGLFGNNAAASNKSVPAQLSVPSQTNQQSAEMLQALMLCPFGDSPLFKNNITDSNAKRKEMTKPTNPAAQKAAIQSPVYRVSSSLPANRVRPTNKHQSPLLLQQGKARQLFAGLENDEEQIANLSRTFVPRSNVKKLMVKLSASSSSSSTSNRTFPQQPRLLATPQQSPSPRTPTNNKPTGDAPRIASSSSGGANNVEQQSQSNNSAQSADDTMAALNVAPPASTNVVATTSDGSHLTPTAATSTANVRTRLTLDDDDDDDKAIGDAGEDEQLFEKHPAGIKLSSGNGYYTKPSLKQLADLTDSDGKCVVDGFTIGRRDYGSVSFKGEIDLTGIDFDSVVQIRRKEVTIYPDDDNKPPLGQGLNRKAEITLMSVWPTDKSTRQPVTDLDRLDKMGWNRKLEQVTTKMGARFLEYKPRTGTWVFQVNHFSKYGLEDSDDDGGEENTVEAEKKKKLAAAAKNSTAANNNKESGDKQKDDKSKQMGQQQVRMWTKDDAVIVVDDGGDVEMTTGDASSTFQPRKPSPPHPPPSQFTLTPRHLSRADAIRLKDVKSSLFADFEEDDNSFSGDRAASSALLKQKSQVEIISSLNPSHDTTGFQTSLFSTTAKPAASTSLLHQTTIVEDINLIGSPMLKKPSSAVVASPMLKTLLSNKPKQQQQNKKARRLPVVSQPVRSLPAQYRDDDVTAVSSRDLSSMMSRSFRVGWARNWTLAHAVDDGGGDVSLLDASKSIFGFSFPQQTGGTKKREDGVMCVQVSRVKPAPHLLQPQPCLAYLRQAFLHSDLTTTTDDVTSNDAMDVTIPPEASKVAKVARVVPRGGNELVMRYAQLSRQQWDEVDKKNPDSGMAHLRLSAFTLCEALWGDGVLDDGEMITAASSCNSKTTEVQQARKGMLMSWLVEVIQADKCATVLHHQDDDDDASSARTIYNCLVEGRIADAVKIAIKAGNGRLAILLSQAIGNLAFRVAISKQLYEWESLRVDAFIHPHYIKIYSLLAAKPVWGSSEGQPINTCEGLEWKKCLLAHLLFISQPQAPLDDAVELYKQAWKGSGEYGVYCTAPLPFYEERSRISLTRDDDDEEEGSKLRDVLYLIIRLYCNRSHSVDKLVTPSSSLPHMLDHRLSWHVWRLLHALGYHRNLSPAHQTNLHVSYAAQLESMGVWHEACFVLMHIVDDDERQRRVTDLIAANLHRATPEEERFVTDELSVPLHLLHDARALLAKSRDRTLDLSRHLLDAERWRMGHDVMMTSLASRSLLDRSGLGELREMLTLINQSRDRTKLIPDWKVAGKIYLDYFQLNDRLAAIKQGLVSDERLESELGLFSEEVGRLCERIHQLRSDNSTDRAARSEMARGTFELHMELTSLKNGGGGGGGRHAADVGNLQQLQLPEDLVLQSLLQLANSHFMSYE